MDAKDIIFTNIDILYNIFQYVDFHEQLKLTRVCSAFQDVIANYLWKMHFKELEVNKSPNFYFLTNRVNEFEEFGLEILKRRQFPLRYNEFDEFLNLNAKNLQILRLVLTQNNGIVLEGQTHFDIKYKFPNLNSVTFIGGVITDDSFIKLSIFCQQLKKICFINCVTSERRSLNLAKHIKLDNIKNIKTLEYLEISQKRSVDDEPPYSYSDVMKILMKLKLLQIKLSVQIESDESHGDFGLLEEDEDAVYPCKVLKLGNLHSLTILWKCLNHFQNLSKLSILGYCTINMNILSNCCKNLTHLELVLLTLTNIAWPKNLSELHLHHCCGLTFTDLENILCGVKLKAFTSTFTEYAGTMAIDITASNTLEYLTFGGLEIAQILQLEEFNGFKKLSYLKFDYPPPTYVLKKFSKKCPNIRKLSLFYNNVSIDDLNKLKSLQKLKVIRATSNLLLILKHPCLTYLVIHAFERTPDTFKCEESTDMTTNLKLINIPLDMFQHFQDFWLNLLNINPKLQIMFSGSPTKYFLDELKTIIRHPKFPDRLKTINICGVIIDCCQFLRCELEFRLSIVLRLQEKCGYIFSQSENEFYTIL